MLSRKVIEDIPIEMPDEREKVELADFIQELAVQYDNNRIQQKNAAMQQRLVTIQQKWTNAGSLAQELSQMGNRQIEALNRASDTLVNTFASNLQKQVSSNAVTYKQQQQIFKELIPMFADTMEKFKDQNDVIQFLDGMDPYFNEDSQYPGADIMAWQAGRFIKRLTFARDMARGNVEQLVLTEEQKKEVDVDAGLGRLVDAYRNSTSTQQFIDTLYDNKSTVYEDLLRGLPMFVDEAAAQKFAPMMKERMNYILQDAVIEQAPEA